MAYSQINIVNLAGGRIGQAHIDSLDEQTPLAIHAKTVWPMVRDMVLAEDDWSFARTQAVLQKSATAPAAVYLYAYPLPADFIKVCREKEGGVQALTWTPEAGVIYVDSRAYGYALEALPDGTQCLMTNFDNSTVELVIPYIRREENPARWSAKFIDALADKLAAELAPKCLGTVGFKVVPSLLAAYDLSLSKAKAHNRSSGTVANETGAPSWADAGR